VKIPISGHSNEVLLPRITKEKSHLEGHIRVLSPSRGFSQLLHRKISKLQNIIIAVPKKTSDYSKRSNCHLNFLYQNSVSGEGFTLGAIYPIFIAVGLQKKTLHFDCIINAVG